MKMKCKLSKHFRLAERDKMGPFFSDRGARVRLLSFGDQQPDSRSPMDPPLV